MLLKEQCLVITGALYIFKEFNMKLEVFNQKGEALNKIDVSDKLFGVPKNDDLIYQVATSQMSNRRQVVAHAKGRGEVRGGGKKPWRQKGTGRARHGSIRSPIWKGGGVTFGPTKERNFTKAINKKMARKAVCVALSAKNREGVLTIVDDIAIAAPKTKELVSVLNSFRSVWNDKGSVLLIAPERNNDLIRAGKNIPSFEIMEARNLNVLDLLSYKRVLMMKDAVSSAEKVFAK